METMKPRSNGTDMQRKLASGLFWVLLLNLIVKPFWILGIEVGVQNAVGAEAYGFYFAIFNLAYIFNILLDVGITNYNTRNIARHPQLIEKHLSGILTVKLMLLGLYAVVTFSVGLLMGYNSMQFHLLAVLSFNQFLNSLILYLRSNFEGLLLFRWDSVISVLDRVIMILLCGAMLWWPEGTLGSTSFTIFHFAYAQTAAYLATALLALAVLVRRTGLRRLRFNRLFSLAVLKQSLPFALLVLLMATYNRIDPLLLQQLLPDSMANTEVGIYAGAFRLLDGLTMIAYLVSVPLLPVYARLTKEDSHAELGETTRWVFSLMMVFAVAAAVTLSCMADPLMELLYDEHTEASARVFRVLIYGIIPIGTTYVFGTLLTAAGRLKVLNLLAFGTLLTGVVVNLLLIPRMGALGAACASLTAQSLMAAAQVVVAVRIFRLRIMPSYILKLALFTLLIVAVNLILPPMPWWGTILAAGIATLATAIPLGLLDIRHLRTLLK